jgi:hypothetical protein
VPPSKSIPIAWGRLVTCGLAIRLVLYKNINGPIANRPQVTNLPHTHPAFFLIPTGPHGPPLHLYLRLPESALATAPSNLPTTKKAPCWN